MTQSIQLSPDQISREQAKSLQDLFSNLNLFLHIRLHSEFNVRYQKVARTLDFPYKVLQKKERKIQQNWLSRS